MEHVLFVGRGLDAFLPCSFIKSVHWSWPICSVINLFYFITIPGEVTSEERATFDKERNLLYQQLDEKDGEINNQSQLISRLQVQ